ncbi:enoyl-CoA hydratase/isomerase family protein [Microbacterium sediminicola]|uniref:3-hydroxyisobutyryl-CoA hydrolase n=1 Tax=Microbacterium sediminicola TaxID=415210 RepID=A0ABP4UCS6_9MICO
MSTTTSRVLIDRRGDIGVVTLNRPEALNALDLEMIDAITGALAAWEEDADIRAVVLRGAGERGLCAGGDVRGLYYQLRAGDTSGPERFFRSEYALNARIAEYRHPIVAVADGITMGGGIGLAGHAAVRVATERSAFAMPETRIGFTPDVGGTWLLGRAPGRLGEYLGLTGATMSGPDAVMAGFADVIVASSQIDALLGALVAGGDLDEVIARFAEPVPAAPLATVREWVDEAFAAASVPAIIAALRSRPEPAAQAVADQLATAAPTALAVTLEAVRRARSLSGVREALAQEFGLIMWFGATQPDMIEGIRAQLVDKDRTPTWQPPTLADLAPSTVTDAFAFAPSPPLWA